MKDIKSFEKYLKSSIAKWQKVLLLDSHTIEIKRGVSNQSSFLECEYRYPYLDNRINYSDDAFKRWKEGKSIEQEIVHELCHIITDQLYAKSLDRYVSKNEIEDARENITDHFANIIHRLKGG